MCRKTFPGLEVRASVNMEIGSVETTGYVDEYFDSFYVARRLNRDREAIRNLRKSGKKLYLLANSGCLKDCPAHIFHDNMVAHEVESEKMEKCWNFKGVCWEYFIKPENQDRLLAVSTFQGGSF